MLVLFAGQAVLSQTSCGRPGVTDDGIQPWISITYYSKLYHDVLHVIHFPLQS